MTRRFEGRVAFVSGGATGIGAAVACRLSREGAAIAVFDINRKNLDLVAQEANALVCAGDVTDPAAVAAAVESTVSRFGRLDVVVNAAGIVIADTPADIRQEDWDRTLAVNLTGTMHVCRSAIPHLCAAAAGSIVNIASVAAFNASVGSASYAASKAGVVAFSRNIAYTYAADNIRCNSLCPGWVRTPMSEMEMEAAAKKSGTTMEQELARLALGIPLGRVATADEMAACVAFLASDDAAFVTAATLIADGGGRIVPHARGF
jgi:NAD(P)-dependent dehydrogenase (short-subunit alcohol dehydrogenase family)